MLKLTVKVAAICTQGIVDGDLRLLLILHISAVFWLLSARSCPISVENVWQLKDSLQANPASEKHPFMVNVCMARLYCSIWPEGPRKSWLHGLSLAVGACMMVWCNVTHRAHSQAGTRL